ncbi:MAG: hypothetical protein NPINA01_05930 [Nitrospinaceae bacterium]|nr:MAG: hypothetical protein NPINA01_05930 [Nitrospinaceae bacterium]
MINTWGHSNDIFDQGYKALRKGVLLFGAFLTVLGILIFMFPKLIAFIFAFFIFFTGISALMIGYRIWKFQNQPRPFEWQDEPLKTHIEVERPESVRRTITFIMR